MPDPNKEDFRASEVADRLKFIEPTPVVILAGAMNSDRDCKTMAGICRGTFNAKATILDSGMGSNIEKHCIRRGVRLIGVCPEACIAYPKLSKKHDNELTNGHSHFFLIGSVNRKATSFGWGDESGLKLDLAKRVAAGRKKSGHAWQNAPACRTVTVVLGDNEDSAMADIENSLNNQIPIIVLEGSPLC